MEGVKFSWVSGTYGEIQQGDQEVPDATQLINGRDRTAIWPHLHDTKIKIPSQHWGQPRDCHDGKGNPIEQRVTFTEYLHVLGSYSNSTGETEAWRGEMTYRCWQGTYNVSSTVLSTQNSSAVKKKKKSPQNKDIKWKKCQNLNSCFLKFRTYALNLETIHHIWTLRCWPPADSKCLKVKQYSTHLWRP